MNNTQEQPEKRSSTPLVLDRSYLTIGGALGILMFLAFIAWKLTVIAWEQSKWQTSVDFNLQIVTERVTEIKDNLQMRNELNAAEIRAIWVRMQKMESAAVPEGQAFDLPDAKEWGKELKRKNTELDVPTPGE